MKLSIFSLAAAFFSGLLACASETTAPAADGEFEVSCEGQVTERSEITDVSIQCASGGPGTRCGDSCAPQDITVRYEPPASKCGSVDVFGWDGAACKAYPTNRGGTMICTGSGCTTLFATADACAAAYATCLGSR